MAQILLEQYNILRLEINSIQFHGQDDIWTYIWGNAQLSSSKVYKSLKGHRDTHAAYSWLLQSSCQTKHKIFYWFLLKDRLSTRQLLRRKNMELQCRVIIVFCPIWMWKNHYWICFSTIRFPNSAENELICKHMRSWQATKILKLYEGKLGKLFSWKL